MPFDISDPYELFCTQEEFAENNQTGTWDYLYGSIGRNDSRTVRTSLQNSLAVAVGFMARHELDPDEPYECSVLHFMGTGDDVLVYRGVDYGDLVDQMPDGTFVPAAKVKTPVGLHVLPTSDGHSVVPERELDTSRYHAVHTTGLVHEVHNVVLTIDWVNHGLKESELYDVNSFTTRVLNSLLNATSYSALSSLITRTGQRVAKLGHLMAAPGKRLEHYVNSRSDCLAVPGVVITEHACKSASARVEGRTIVIKVPIRLAQFALLYNWTPPSESKTAEKADKKYVPAPLCPV